jgi:hypothetical protein
VVCLRAYFTLIVVNVELWSVVGVVVVVEYPLDERLDQALVDDDKRVGSCLTTQLKLIVVI